MYRSGSEARIFHVNRIYLTSAALRQECEYEYSVTVCSRIILVFVYYIHDNKVGQQNCDAIAGYASFLLTLNGYNDTYLKICKVIVISMNLSI